MITRTDVLNIVRKYLLENLEDMAESDIDPAKSMMDIGATSMDVIEVVSCTMRELKVKVPRSELAQLENINELVDLLHDAVKKKEDAQRTGG